jgi:hypothetical protein
LSANDISEQGESLTWWSYFPFLAFLYFHVRNFSLRARFAFCFAASLGKVTPHDALRAYPRPYART